MNRKKKIIHHTKLFIKSSFWFFIGVLLGIFFIGSFAFFLFQRIYAGKIIPGVYIGDTNFEGKTLNQVQNYFYLKNSKIQNSKFTFYYDGQVATASARYLGIGYDSNLIANQAYSIGRSNYAFSDLYNVINSYINGTFLNPSYTFNQDKLKHFLNPIVKNLTISPVDAKFVFTDGRVTTFQPSSDGQAVDINQIVSQIQRQIPYLLSNQKNQNIRIKIPIIDVKPKINTNSANNLGIKDLLGTGESLFQQSIPSRIFNVELAASRINGALIPPGQIFSFDQTVGDVSSLTGYKQAYIIQNGQTVLGDGGGVCQVSTTLFRAILNAGLPIVERHAHAYRVEYYEEDGPPGIDATVYVPTVDLKFKNDTNHYILIQEVLDPDTLRLSFNLYGTSDGRIATLTTPVVTNQTPAPTPLYTNDPSLPKGVVQQTDFAAGGADVSFSRTVKRDGKIILQDTYTSDYQPWQAKYLVGTGG